MSPVSFLASVVALPKKGMPVRIEADEPARAALAEAHGLVSVESFLADLVVSTWRADGVRVAGRVEADIVQNCVVTLEPLASRVEEEFDVVMAPEGSRLLRPDAGEGGEILLDPEGPDSPDSFSGNQIDVGALAEEHFALGIDPYPRKQGVELENETGGEAEKGPLFDQLKRLTGRD